MATCHPPVRALDGRDALTSTCRESAVNPPPPPPAYIPPPAMQAMSASSLRLSSLSAHGAACSCGCRSASRARMARPARKVMSAQSGALHAALASGIRSTHTTTNLHLNRG